MNRWAVVMMFIAAACWALFFPGCATAAEAEESWVVWQGSQTLTMRGAVPVVSPREWTRRDAFETRRECQAARVKEVMAQVNVWMARGAQLEAPSGPELRKGLFVRVNVNAMGVSLINVDERKSVILGFVCFSATEDPARSGR